MKKICKITLFSLLTLNIYAQKIELDESFNKTGILYKPLGFQNDFCSNLLLKDDVLIATGTHGSDKNFNFAAVYLNQDGSDNTSLGNLGSYNSDFKDGNDRGLSSAIQKNNILICGFAKDSNIDRLAILRYNEKGILDRSFFGIEGKVIFKEGEESYGRSILVLDDNSFMVCGTIKIKNNSYGLVVKYNENGTIDKNFALNGVLVIDPVDGVYINKIVKFQDKFLSICSIKDANSRKDQLGIYCFDKNGVVDKSYGDNGKTIYTLDVNNEFSPNNAYIQKDGKLVVSGTWFVNDFFSLFVKRFDINGKEDKTFNDKTKVLGKIFKKNAMGRAMTLLPNDDIILAGEYHSSPGFDRPYMYDLFLFHLSKDGEINKNIGKKGLITIETPAESEELTSVLYSNNNLFLGGFSESSKYKIFIAKLKISGFEVSK